MVEPLLAQQAAANPWTLAAGPRREPRPCRGLCRLSKGLSSAQATFRVTHRHLLYFSIEMRSRAKARRSQAVRGSDRTWQLDLLLFTGRLSRMAAESLYRTRSKASMSAASLASTVRPPSPSQASPPSPSLAATEEQDTELASSMGEPEQSTTYPPSLASAAPNERPLKPLPPVDRGREAYLFLLVSSRASVSSDCTLNYVTCRPPLSWRP